MYSYCGKFNMCSESIDRMIYTAKYLYKSKTPQTLYHQRRPRKKKKRRKNRDSHRNHVIQLSRSLADYGSHVHGASYCCGR